MLGGIGFAEGVENRYSKKCSIDSGTNMLETAEMVVSMVRVGAYMAGSGPDWLKKGLSRGKEGNVTEYEVYKDARNWK